MARGVAILLVVAGHCCSSNTGYLNRMILSFHMPLFFFLSGTFAKDGLGGVKNKIKRLLLPQVLLALLETVRLTLPKLLRGEQLIDYNWISPLGSWFLPTLFLCTIIYMLLTSCINIKTHKAYVLILVVDLIFIWLSLYVFNISNGFFTKFFKLLPVGFLFYILGKCCSNYSLSINKGENRLMEAIIIIALLLVFIISQWNSPVKMYTSEYGLFPLFIVTSITGIFAVVEIMKRLKPITLLEEIGKISIAIYVWNFIVTSFTKSIVFRILNNTDLYTDGVLAAISFIISIILLYLFSRLTLKCVPFVYGIDRGKFTK